MPIQLSDSAPVQLSDSARVSACQQRPRASAYPPLRRVSAPVRLLESVGGLAFQPRRPVSAASHQPVSERHSHAPHPFAPSAVRRSGVCVGRVALVLTPACRPSHHWYRAWMAPPIDPLPVPAYRLCRADDVDHRDCADCAFALARFHLQPHCLQALCSVVAAHCLYSYPRRSPLASACGSRPFSFWSCAASFEPRCQFAVRFGAVSSWRVGVRDCSWPMLGLVRTISLTSSRRHHR